MSGRRPPPEPFEHAARSTRPARDFEPVYHSDEGVPLELVYCLDEPLVHALMTSTRRWRDRLTLGTAGVALLASAAAAAGHYFERGWGPGFVAPAVGAFL